MKVLVSGAALALVLGVIGGRAMHLDLNIREDRPMGPQMFADWVGAGSTGPFDQGTSFEAAYKTAAYSPGPGGKVPDYIYGTDWKRSTAWPAEAAAVTKASYEAPADAPTRADAPEVARADDTTVAERDPHNPSREPAYDVPAAEPDSPGSD